MTHIYTMNFTWEALHNTTVEKQKGHISMFCHFQGWSLWSGRLNWWGGASGIWVDGPLIWAIQSGVWGGPWFVLPAVSQACSQGSTLTGLPSVTRSAHNFHGQNFVSAATLQTQTDSVASQFSLCVLKMTWFYRLCQTVTPSSPGI